MHQKQGKTKPKEYPGMIRIHSGGYKGDQPHDKTHDGRENEMNHVYRVFSQFKQAQVGLLYGEKPRRRGTYFFCTDFLFLFKVRQQRSAMNAQVLLALIPYGPASAGWTFFFGSNFHQTELLW
jgi:hypothetical protein